MRIATWNCARGPWPEKRKAIESIGADITVVTEAPKAAKNDGLVWFGSEGAPHGTTLIAGPAYSVSALQSVPSAPCVNAVRVEGPVSLTVLLVWTWPAKPFKNYKDPLLAGLTAHGHHPGPLLIAGDFNGNVCFDRPRTKLKWSSCFEQVERHGVVSAYHSFFNEPYGGESRWTQYQTRKVGMPFHLDYVFMPSEWRSRISAVRVPGFDEFQLSDHRPVIVDLEGP